MLTRSIPIPGPPRVLLSRVRGRSCSSLLCWETVVCFYLYCPCSSGLENNAVPEDNALSRDTCACALCHSHPKPGRQTAPSFPPASTRLEERQRRELAPGLTFLHSPANGQKRKAPTKQKSRWQQKGNRGEVEGAELWLPGQTNASTDVLPPNNCPAPAEPQQIRKHKRDFIFSPLSKFRRFCSALPNTLQGLWIGELLSWHHSAFN